MSPRTKKAAGATGNPIDGKARVKRARQDFPALAQSVRGKALVYLDNAATAHKPRSVIDAVSHYYGVDYSNVHRGVHYLSERATRAYEQARERIRAFINAQDNREVVFVRGTTEAINLVAQSFGAARLRAGDEILVTEMEHHANIVPWQMLCERVGTVLRVAPINNAGELRMDEFQRQLSPRTRLVAVTHMSNALGTINPVGEITELAHRHGARVLIDGAQAAPHLAVDVQALDCDFYAFSGHKVFGPTGIGVLYGKSELLEIMPPYQGGGEMIRTVTFDKTTYADIPLKFEAGTPHFVGAIGLAHAINYLCDLGLDVVAEYEQQLLDYATEALKSVPGVHLVGTARHKGSIISFTVEGVHAHDVGTILDHEGVAVRTGHHCAMPVMEHFGVSATARASLAFYNTREDVDALAAALRNVRQIFHR